MSPWATWRIDRHRHDGCTIRWRRGDPVAYVLGGKRIGDYGITEVVDTIPVSLTGWTDLAEIRLLGQRWLRQSTRLRPSSTSPGPACPLPHTPTTKHPGEANSKT